MLPAPGISFKKLTRSAKSWNKKREIGTHLSVPGSSVDYGLFRRLIRTDAAVTLDTRESVESQRGSLFRVASSPVMSKAEARPANIMAFASHRLITTAVAVAVISIGSYLPTHLRGFRAQFPAAAFGRGKRESSF